MVQDRRTTLRGN